MDADVELDVARTQYRVGWVVGWMDVWTTPGCSSSSYSVSGGWVHTVRGGAAATINSRGSSSMRFLHA